MQYVLVEDVGERGPWRISITAYEYALLAADDQELLAFHWDPTGRSHVKRPHLHIETAACVGGKSDLIGRHLPTGRVALEEVLRCAITELGTQPIREDWATVLDSNQEHFEQWRTWPAPRSHE